jgi:hypothetical protein
MLDVTKVQVLERFDTTSSVEAQHLTLWIMESCLVNVLSLVNKTVLKQTRKLIKVK